MHASCLYLHSINIFDLHLMLFHVINNELNHALLYVLIISSTGGIVVILSKFTLDLKFKMPQITIACYVIYEKNC